MGNEVILPPPYNSLNLPDLSRRSACTLKISLGYASLPGNFPDNKPICLYALLCLLKSS